MNELNPLKHIIYLCEERNWSFYQLAKASGVTYSTLHTMMKKNNMPSLSTLEKLCKGFGITMAEFFEADCGQAALTEDQQECLSLFSALSKADRKLALTYLKGLAKKL